MTITRFDRTNLTQLRSALQHAVKSVEQEFGIRIDVANATFSDNNVRIKLECATKDENGKVNSKEAEDFKELCGRYNLKQTDLGREFVGTNGEDRYRIVGCNPRARKMPIICENLANRKRYKFAPRTIEFCLATQD